MAVKVGKRVRVDAKKMTKAHSKKVSESTVRVQKRDAFGRFAHGFVTKRVAR